MFCAKCGTENKDGSSFCKNCGSSIDALKNTSAQSVSRTSVNKKFVIIILVLFILLAAIILIPALNKVNRDSNIAESEQILTESDIIGKWYLAKAADNRTVYMFSENGEVRTWDEFGDFFNSQDEGRLCGTWEIIGKDGIKITYDEETNTSLKWYFGESGLGGVVLYEDGKQIKFIVHGELSVDITLQKYPNVL